MAKKRPNTRARPHNKTPNRTPNRRTPPPRRRVSPLVLAAVAVVAASALLFAVTRGGNTPSGADPAFLGGDLHSLIAMSDGRVYVGGHDGVALTRDNGRSWTQVASLAHADAMGWGIQDSTLFVSGHPGLNRSTDNGATFRRSNDGLPDTDVHSFGAGAGVLYAAGPNLGVVASTDGGHTWQPRSSDAGRSFFGQILIDPANTDRVVAADAQAGPVVSVDGGRTWRTLGAPSATWVSSPDGLRTLIASGGGTASRSIDGGTTWQPLTLPDGALIVEAAPGDGQRLYAAGLAGTTARLWISTDAGATWTAA